MHLDVGDCSVLKVDHNNFNKRLFINIRLFMESCQSKGFSSQLNETFAQIYWYDVLMAMYMYMFE